MKQLLMMVLFLTMPVGMACGSGGNGTPDVSDEGPDQGTEVTADVPPSGNCIPPAGTDFRFTHLSVVQPTDPDGVVKDLLNDLWREDIKNDILNIIYRITAVDEEGQTLSLISASATAMDSDGHSADEEEFTQEGVTYTMIEEIKSSFEMSIDGCNTESIAPGTIIMRTATVSIKDDPECDDVKGIHLENLVFTTEMSADGTEIIAGTINGVLPGHVGDCVMAGGLPGGAGVAFGWFLTIANVDPNLDTDDDGENDAWIFDATFRAIKIDNVMP